VVKYYTIYYTAKESPVGPKGPKTNTEFRIEPESSTT